MSDSLTTSGVWPTSRAALAVGIVTLLTTGCGTLSMDAAGSANPRSAGSEAATAGSSATARPTTPGSTGVSPTAHGSIVSPPPGGAATIQNYESLDGKQIQLRVGQRLVVRLATCSYDRPGVTAMLQPLRVDAAAGFPATGPALARFNAVRTGTATVAVHTDYRCLNAMPRCALPQQFFSVAVRVLAPASHGGGPLPKPAVCWPRRWCAWCPGHTARDTMTDCGFGYGIGTPAMKMSWSLAIGAFGAEPVQTVGGDPGVPVPGHKNSSTVLVSAQIGYAVVAVTSIPA